MVQKSDARGNAAGAERGSFPLHGKERTEDLSLAKREINDVRDEEREKERK